MDPISPKAPAYLTCLPCLSSGYSVTYREQSANPFYAINPMTTSQLSPSFPPIDDAIHALRSVDRDRLLLNMKRAAGVASDCLIWAAALTVIAIQQGRKLLPHIATLLRAIADRLDPDSAPLTQPMTARDIPDTLEYFQARSVDRMKPPVVNTPTDAELAIDADLVDLAKSDLMRIYGTKSRRMTKEQLIHKITERRLITLEEGK